MNPGRVLDVKLPHAHKVGTFFYRDKSNRYLYPHLNVEAQMYA